MKHIVILGQRFGPRQDEEVANVASGNLVYNLHTDPGVGTSLSRTARPNRLGWR
jgi:hypothetical protein